MSADEAKTGGAEPDREEAKTKAEDTGRRRIRRILIQPLLERGLTRPRNMRAEDFEIAKTRIADRLVWITDEIAETLVDMSGREAPSRSRDFPTEDWLNRTARELAKAHGIDVPVDLPKKVTTYLRSVAGRNAWENGPHHAMALYRWLMTHPGVPAGERACSDILAFAEEYDRDLAVNMREGGETWLEAYRQRRALVESLVYPDGRP